MARLARGEYLDPQTVQVVHATSRCVRRAFLCGEDPQTGRSFEHRRAWIRDRLEFLASVFAIDCLTYAVLSNHLHLILRSRPDIVRDWSNEEVARRWFRLCPPRDNNGLPVEPSDFDIEMLVSNTSKIAALRVRLSDVSWWMRMTSEKIARQANKEDECTGRFWEGRYKAQLLLDEAAVLACALYVDLNPIRAAMAESLEDSHYTGAKERIDDLKSGIQCDLKSKHPPDPSTRQLIDAIRSRTSTSHWERSKQLPQSGWLSPIEINESRDGSKTQIDKRRASVKGFLPVSLARYLELLDWTGRQLRGDKRGSIPASVAPILTRLGLESNSLSKLARGFGRLFKRAAGNRIAISEEAQRRQQSWMQAPGALLFG